MDDDIGNRRPVEVSPEPEPPVESSEDEELAEQDAALLERLGDPPLDPVENARWANNAAAAWACIVQRRKGLSFKDRLQMTMRCLDRVGVTTGKATTAKEIAELKEKAGVSKTVKSDANRVVSIANSGARRAQSRAIGRAVAGSMPVLPKEDDERNPPDGGR